MSTNSLSVSKPELKLIYKKLGGEPKLLALLRDFYDRMSNDALIGFFFEAKDLKAIASKQMAFLQKAMGAAETYS